MSYVLFGWILTAVVLGGYGAAIVARGRKLAQRQTTPQKVTDDQ